MFDALESKIRAAFKTGDVSGNVADEPEEPETEETEGEDDIDLDEI